VDSPEYDYHDGLQLRVFAGGTGTASVTVTTPEGRAVTYDVDLEEITG
jgi:alpha-D-xyloside xylohydrolase